MTKYIRPNTLVLKTAAVALLWLSGCDKSLDVTDIQPQPYASVDANGGQWKTILLASGGELAVPAPKEVSSAEYRAELTALKQTREAATAEQQQAVRYWGAGAVLRWNEIARELAAQYNVPPNNNPDGTYPVPDPTNPLQRPRFPFANPPYAARVFALLSVAQYDALVTAWRAKYAHNRPAPSKTDASINSLLPGNDLPAYPSEDAVVAAASREILKAMFPGEVPMLEAKAKEHQDSRRWAGANVQSDIDAGEALGKAVAQRVMAYAKADGMSKSNNQADYPKLKEAAAARGITAMWTSREIPVRPPLLPFYGNVKNWNFDETTKIALRPAAPPAVGTPEFQKDLEEMRNISRTRTREQMRIANFWADGPGTYTPPGHWNRKAAELIHAARHSELRAARTLALVNTALMDAGVCCWETKFYYLTQRPSEVDPAIRTVTGIPNFPGYTSGHSTFSGAAATVLGYVFPDKKAELEAMAKEASESRIYGGIHFRVDCEVGLRCGNQIGGFAVRRAQADGAQ